MNPFVEVLLTICMICCPCLSSLLCAFFCYLPTGLHKIKQKLCGRRRRRSLYPNVRNSIDITIDPEEASIYDIIDNDVSNSQRPSRLKQILQKEHLNPFY